MKSLETILQSMSSKPSTAFIADQAALGRKDSSIHNNVIRVPFTKLGCFIRVNGVAVIPDDNSAKSRSLIPIAFNCLFLSLMFRRDCLFLFTQRFDLLSDLLSLFVCSLLKSLSNGFVSAAWLFNSSNS
jgi:hypothetical protein